MSELDSARRLIARGKSEQAARLLAELIAEHPDHKDAWLMMAKAVKDPQQKLDCFKRVLEIDPDNPIAKKGAEEAKRQIFISGVKKQVEQSRSKTVREKKINPEKGSRVQPLRKLLKTKYLLPVIFFILLTVIVFLVLKNRPSGTATSSTATPVALVQETQIATTPTQSSTAIPTEDPQKIFAALPFHIYYSLNGKLWLWQVGAAKSLSDIDASRSLIANEQTGQVLFALHGNLWEMDGVTLSRKVLISGDAASTGTPSPTSSSQTIILAGIVPGTNEILFSTSPGAALSIAQADGSGIAQLLTSGEVAATYPSPDGKWLAVVNSRSIRLLSLSGKTILGVLDYAPIPTSDSYLLPVPQWAEDSSRFLVAIPPADFTNDLNAPTSIWQMNSAGQETSYASIQSRGGVLIFSADLRSVFYQLNLTSVSDYFGELHRANIDGSLDTILLKGQLVHLIGMDTKGSQAVFQLQDNPRSIQMQDTSTAQYHRILDGLEAETVLSIMWIDDLTFLYQTSQTDSDSLWLARFDGAVHRSLLLAENSLGSKIPACFTPK
jgi:hypothetical protein